MSLIYNRSTLEHTELDYSGGVQQKNDNCKMRGVYFQELCCTQTRCAIPTNDKHTLPFFINIFGLTCWFKSRPIFAAIATVGDLKEMFADKEFASEERRNETKRGNAVVDPPIASEESKP